MGHFSATRRVRRAPPEQQQDAPCHRCRSRRHSPSSCWARNRRCFQCGEMGHVRDACRAAAGRGRVDRVEDDDVFDVPVSPSESEEAAGPDDAAEEVYTLFYQYAPSNRCRPLLYVDIKLNGRAVQAEVDTGAAVSVCSVEQFHRLFPKGGPKITPSRRKLCTYGGKRLPLRGEAIVCVQYGAVSVNLPLIVAEGTGPVLFGRDWLAYFKLDWTGICHMADVAPPSKPTGKLVTADSALAAVLAEYAVVFNDELGCFKGEKVTIDVDPDAAPRFFKARPVPLAYRSRVDSELDRQIKLGLWEEVKDSKFLRNLATVLTPLCRLLQKGEPWCWGGTESEAFGKAKALLLNPPVLAHFDSRLPVMLACDASPTGIGVVLSQRTQQEERPVAFYSRSLNPTERRYSQTDREALSVIYGVKKKINHYLAGREFVIRSDYKPLLGLLGERKPIPVMASPRMVRWALMLSGYSYRLEYMPASKQTHCDGLSRLPLPGSTVTSPTPAEVVNLLEFLDSSPVTSRYLEY